MAETQALDPNLRATARALEMAQTDPQLAALLPDQAVTDAIREEGLTFSEVIDRVLTGYAARPALGRRAYSIEDGADGRSHRNHRPEFDFITYGELRRRVTALVSAWRNSPEHWVTPGEFMCIFGFTGVDYVTCDLAGPYGQVVTVPLQANLPAPDVMDVFADVQPALLVVAIESLDAVALLAAEAPSVRSLIVIDADMRDDDEREAVERARKLLSPRIAVATLQDLVAFGETFDWTPTPRHPDGIERLNSLVYTSGSTGTPKGAMYTEKISMWPWVSNPRPRPTVTLAFAPMNHMIGRNTIFGAFIQGGSACLTLKSDMSTLFEDIRLARPTFLSLIPRVAELIWHHFQAETVRRAAGREHEMAAVEAEVRAEMQANFLGDRLLVAQVGSAPTAPEVKAFIRDCFDIAFNEGYGSTESGGPLAFHNRIDRRFVTDYRLRDVPELGYYTTDKPYPRGELLFKSSMAIPGYFKRPEATRQLYTEDGWQQTGDVVEERGPDEIVWLDRKNNVLKLAQAEFVAIGPLEAAFESGHALIKQIYLYGNSYRAYLLGVVVPDMAVAEQLAGHVPGDAELKRMILAGMQDTARAMKLKGFEVPRDVIIEHEPFSLENGLLSSVRKPLRPNLKRKYGDQLEDLYIQMEQKQRADLLALRNPKAGMTVLERVGAALGATLGLDDIDLEKAQTFADLGGDSLGAASFAVLLEEIFGVPAPVSAILSPVGSPKRWAAMIEAALSGEPPAISVEKIHGADPPPAIRAADLDLNQFLDAKTLRAAEHAEPARSEVRTVLLTGATGYLGRFLALEWLEQLSRVDGRLICLIRARDTGQARQRLDEAIGTADPVLAKRFAALADKHLEVLAGDLVDPNLGLADSDYARLAGSVDLICHPAAFVNHALAYEHLFEPNVAGTAELIRLAITSRRKRFDFVSSTAVATLCSRDGVALEDDDVREKRPEISLGDGYAVGYGASKWAGEVLLREANDLFGLPVNVYRSDMILAHRAYRGQLNVADWFSRLLFSMATTGLAPGSFYELDADGGRQTAHYEGLPVDFTASVMVELGLQDHADFRSFNIINFHDDDGVSLDRVADWVASAGYPLERGADHGEWLARFEQKLRNLPEDQKAHSSISLLHGVAKPHPVKGAPRSTAAFQASLKTLRAGPDAPHISEAYVHKHLDDLRVLGVLAPPSTARAPEGVG